MKLGTDIESLTTFSKIDLTKDVKRPETVLSIREAEGTTFSRVMTLGNFSVITGKQKSKKTFWCTMVAAAGLKGQMYGRLKGNLHDKGLFTFDTEQGTYDAWHTAKRIGKITGMTAYQSFALREHEPVKRCEIIEEVLKNNQVGLAIIDGIADLASGINDEEEATRVSGLLMRWTKEYDCHIVSVIHQNKNDNYATGHLGSSLMKKAEVIISVKKDIDNKRQSFVECDMIRGSYDFDQIIMEVRKDGLPGIVGEEDVQATIDHNDVPKNYKF